MLEARSVAPDATRVIGDLREDARKPLRRDPDAQVAVTERSRATHGSRRPAADDDRNPRLHRRRDLRGFEAVELAFEIERLARHQPAQDRERFVSAAAAGARIHAAHLVLVGILAPHTDPEQQTPRRTRGDALNLPGDGGGVAERQKIDGDGHLECVVQTRDLRRMDESVEAGAHEEAHVVGHGHVIQTAVSDRFHHGLSLGDGSHLCAARNSNPHLDVGHLEAASLRFPQHIARALLC